MRGAWIAWCLFWAVVWFFFGIVFFPFWILTIASVAAAIIPIGASQQQHRQHQEQINYEWQPGQPVKPLDTSIWATIRSGLGFRSY